MKQLRPAFVGILVGLVITRLSLPALAQDSSTGPPTRAEFSKLQTDVREQRQLIIQMLQTEQQRYDMLLKLLQGQGGGTAMVPAPAPLPDPEASAAEGLAKRAEHARSGGPLATVEHRNAPVEGSVSFQGTDRAEIYVYVEGVRAPLARNKGIEVRQEGKQFVPRVAVVQTGTVVTFPNFDTVFHNVFSNSSRNSFDLGTYQAGEKPRSVTLTGSGVVEVFCNIHQKMNAKILVVPNTLYARVKPDGTFRIDNVPTGQRRLVAWSPNARPVQQKVDVTAQGAKVSFSLEQQEASAHPNKLGQAYGSYRE